MYFADKLSYPSAAFIQHYCEENFGYGFAPV